MDSTTPKPPSRDPAPTGVDTQADNVYVEIRVPMSEVELDRVIAHAKKHGVAADEYVAHEIRAYLAKQPKASFLICEMKLVRSITGGRRGR